jgi:hypothetical protein
MDNEPVKWDVNPGFIICWIGILILQGAHFGLEKRTAKKMWQWSPYGLSVPHVRNQCDKIHLSFYVDIFILQTITNKNMRVQSIIQSKICL